MMNLRNTGERARVATPRKPTAHATPSHPTKPLMPISSTNSVFESR